MTDRPILFSAPMVKALLAGRKTQTRRVLNPQPIGFDWFDLRCKPRFAVGDRLWVREAWHAARSLDRTPPREIPCDADIEHAATARNYAEIGLKGKLRPGMYLPRWASRLTLTVTEVRVQRLQAITTADALLEGVDVGLVDGIITRPNTRDSYRELWDSLNADRGFGWDTNPWVVAVSFTVAHRNIDAEADRG